MTRVLWIIETFYPPIVGGAELLASFLTEGLALRGVPVTVLTRQTVPPSANHERIATVDVLRIRPGGFLKGIGWRALPYLLWFLLNLAWVMIRERRNYDVVVTSGIKVMPLVVTPMAALLRKRVLLRVESDFELHEAVSSESLDRMGWLSRHFAALVDEYRLWLLRRADRVVAISDQIFDELQKRHVPTERIVRIPNGIDCRKYSPATESQRTVLRAKLGLPKDRLLVTYSGRLSRAKGVLLLLEAWRELAASRPDLLLTIVGSGSASFDSCEAQARAYVDEYRLQSSVKFVGESSHVVDYLQATDLWISPSEYEGFGLALAEAMSCALPVVSTRVGAAPQFIQDGVNGFLCEPKDLKSITAALTTALERQPDWPQIGAGARRAIEPYDLSAITDRYVALANDLAAQR